MLAIFAISILPALLVLPAFQAIPALLAQTRAPARQAPAGSFAQNVEYVGFTIDDHFVVGYGLDYAEQYRNLPHIGIVS